jgi:hypothetical protein
MRTQKGAAEIASRGSPGSLLGAGVLVCRTLVALARPLRRVAASQRRVAAIKELAGRGGQGSLAGMLPAPATNASDYGQFVLIEFTHLGVSAAADFNVKRAAAGKGTPLTPVGRFLHLQTTLISAARRDTGRRGATGPRQRDASG